jgi:dTDP-glucose 4,6-dehydratase
MRLEDGRLVPAFVGQALRGEDFTVFGDGTQTRSFCYAKDLIDGLVRLALSDVTEPVNLGNPRELSILRVAEAVRNVHGGDGRIVFKPLPRDDPRQRKPDISRARTLLGWEPRVSLEEGLVETFAWFRKVMTPRAPVPAPPLREVTSGHWAACHLHALGPILPLAKPAMTGPLAPAQPQGAARTTGPLT